MKQIKNQLQSICNCTQFKRLELCFNRIGWDKSEFIEAFTFLQNLKHLTGLHILRCDFDLPTNVILEHLTVLQLAHVPKITTLDLSKNLPNLEELYLMFLSKNFQELVTPFARYAVKLNKIVSRDFKISNRKKMTNFRLAKCLNDEREHLANACKLFIYFGKDEFDYGLNSMFPMPNFHLVQIRRVEFQSKEVDYMNPFLRSYEF